MRDDSLIDDASSYSDKNDLERAIALGSDVETFLSSTTGRHIMERAREEMLDALEVLRTVDPFGAREDMARAQNNVRVPELVMVWLKQAVETGKSAAAQLQQAETTPVDPV